MKSCSLVIVASMIVFSVQALAIPVAICVDPNAAPGGDGSYGRPFRDFQDAIAYAETIPETAVSFQLAAGLYRPDRGNGDRSADFRIGFGEKTFSEIDVQGNYGTPTVLSGDLRDDDQTGFRNRDDNSYAILSIRAKRRVGVSTLTMRGASAVGAGGESALGGALSIDVFDTIGTGAGSLAELSSCLFEENQARQSPGAAVRLKADRADVRFCRLVRNRSLESVGGGMSLQVGHDYYGGDIYYTWFEENEAVSGGGLYVDGYVHSLQNIFVGNRASSQGGGAYGLYDCTSSLFLRNAAGVSGGGFVISERAKNTTPLILTTTLAENSAPEGSAMAFVSESPWIFNAIVWNNAGENSIRLYGPRYQTEISNSVVQGGAAAVASDGLLMRVADSNRDADPRFRRPGPVNAPASEWRNWNYRLRGDSAALDIGGQNFGYADLDSRRPFSGWSERKDAGCYFVHADVCPGDLDYGQGSPYGSVTDSDFLEFLKAYSLRISPPARVAADLNFDGLVDDEDFDLFAMAYDQVLCE